MNEWVFCSALLTIIDSAAVTLTLQYRPTATLFTIKMSVSWCQRVAPERVVGILL